MKFNEYVELLVENENVEIDVNVLPNLREIISEAIIKELAGKFYDDVKKHKLDNIDIETATKIYKLLKRIEKDSTSLIKDSVSEAQMKFNGAMMNGKNSKEWSEITKHLH